VWRSETHILEIPRKADADEPTHPQRGPDAAVKKHGRIVERGEGVHAQPRDALNKKSDEHSVAQDCVRGARPRVVRANLPAEGVVRVLLQPIVKFHLVIHKRDHEPNDRKQGAQQRAAAVQRVARALLEPRRERGDLQRVGRHANRKKKEESDA
jgi:hypothetical protein